LNQAQERRPSIAASILIALVKLYRLTLSPYLGGSCRFHPSCSLYALDALARFGAMRGATLAAARVIRCNPFCEGGMDPVPAGGEVRWRRSISPTPTPSAPPTPSR
jgi:uncharacterized protein